MHLNASHNGHSVHTPRTKVLQMANRRENKQTNMQFSAGGIRTAQATPLLAAPSKAAGPLPLTRTLPGALAAGTKPPLCARLLWGSQPGRTLGRLRRGHDRGPFGRAEVIGREGGVGGVGRLE